MDGEHSSRKDALLYWFLAVSGAGLVLVSFFMRISDPNSVWADLLLNVGATLISTTVLAFLYQRFSSQRLINQITEMRHTLGITQRALELGIRDLWPRRRHISNHLWNTFTESARSEVWLFGIAESGFAEDDHFRRIVSHGTARGCRYRILLLNPSSTAATEIDTKQGGGEQIQGRIRLALKKFQEMQKENSGKPGSVEILVYSDVPYVSIIRSDDELLVTQYMLPLMGDSCFTYRIQNVPGGIFEQYKEYLEAIWEKGIKPPNSVRG